MQSEVDATEEAEPENVDGAAVAAEGMNASNKEHEQKAATSARAASQDPNPAAAAANASQPPVSGQVAVDVTISEAGKKVDEIDNNNPNIPINLVELADDVRFLPRPVHKAYLCDATTEIRPCLQPNHVLQILVKHPGTTTILPIPNRLPVPFTKKHHDAHQLCTIKSSSTSNNANEDDQEELYAGGAYLSGRPKNDNRCILKDKEDKTVVVCQRDPGDGSLFSGLTGNRTHTFYLHGRTSLLDDDEDDDEGDAKDKDDDKKDTDDDEKEGIVVVHEEGTLIRFYPWYRISSYRKGNFDYRIIGAWNGKDFTPVAKIQNATPPNKAGPILETTQKVLNKTPTNQAVVLTSMAAASSKTTTAATTATDEETHETAKKEQGDEEEEEVEYFAILERVSDKGGWKVTCAPGIDPALCIWTAAIVADFPDYFCQDHNPFATKLS